MVLRAVADKSIATMAPPLPLPSALPLTEALLAQHDGESSGKQLVHFIRVNDRW